MIREITEEVNMRAKEPHNTLAFWVALFALVGFLFMFAGSVHASSNLYAPPAIPKELYQVVEDARQNGGLLIECRSGACRDTENGDPIDYENDRDGYYIVYPDDVYTTLKYKETKRAAEAARIQ